VWGGYTVTPRWLDVPHRKETFLLLARHGINAVQIRALLGDFFHDPRYPEISNPRWKENVNHLRRILRQANECGLDLILHADNFRLPPDHPFFRRKPLLKGSPIFRGEICTLCTGSREGLDLIAHGWERIFREVPGLGGMIAIIGGECFTHCAMRPVRDEQGRNTCPRCSTRRPADVAADLINAVSLRVRRVAPQAKILAWPYAAEAEYVWNADEDELKRFMRRTKNSATYVLEIDNDGTQPVRGEPGMVRWLNDYSSSFVGPSSKFRFLSKVADELDVHVCVKTETLQGWEGGLMPYMPHLDHWRRRWEILRKSPARDIHMGWPVYGFNDAPPAEIAAWNLWSPAPAAGDVLDQMIDRDFGRPSRVKIRKAYRLLGEALEMLPCHLLAYYSQIQVMGSANPLLLKADESLADEFLSFHYYHGEGYSTTDSTTVRRPLPYSENGVHLALTPEGLDTNMVAARCVHRAADAWDRAMRLYESVRDAVPRHRRDHFQNEHRLIRHLGHMWRTWAHAEEFYRLRARLEPLNFDCHLKHDFYPYRIRILNQMLAIAKQELKNSRAAWANVRGDDRLDTSLRLDVCTVPMPRLYAAKFRHTGNVIKKLASEIARSNKQYRARLREC